MNTSLIERKEVSNGRESTRQVPEFLADQEKQREEDILAELPGRGKLDKERERLAKLEQELREKEQAELAKFNQLDRLHNQRNAAIKSVARAQYYVDAAIQHRGDIKETIRQWIFEGLHPQFGGDTPPITAINISSQIAGCDLIIETHASWAAKNAEQIEKLGAEMVGLARELRIVDRLPADLQEHAK